MGKNMFALYKRALPAIRYAKEHDLLKAGTTYRKIPERYHIKNISTALESALTHDGISCYHHCPPRCIIPGHPCDHWSCAICSLDAIDQYMKNRGIKYD